jgi:hypothetical protein
VEDRVDLYPDIRGGGRRGDHGNSAPLRDEPDVLVQELLRNGDRRSIVAACGAIGGVCGLILFLAAFSGAFGDPRRALFSHTLTMWTLMLGPLVACVALGYVINGLAHAVRRRRLALSRA